MSASAAPLDPPAAPVATPPTAVLFDGLTFFTPDGELRSVRRELEAGEPVSLAARLLALPQGGVPASRLVRRLWSVRSRIDAARLLLAEAMAHDRGGRQRLAQETWSWVTQEWTWMARSSRAARALCQELGCTTEVMDQLQHSIAAELLPMLHLLAALRAGPGALAPCHLELVAQLELREDAPPGLVVAAALVAAALGESKRAVPLECLDHVARAVAGKLLGPRIERSILTHFTRGLAGTISRTESLFALASLIEPLERLSESTEPNLALMEVLSLLHGVMAIRSAPQDGFTAYQLLGKALVYDPSEAGAREQRERFRDMDRMGVPVYARRQVQQRLERSDAELKEFALSARGKRIQGRFHAAVELELAERLNLDAADPRHRWAVAGLLAHLARVRATPEAKLRQEDIAQAWPELAAFPVQHLEQALNGIGNAPLPWLGLLLPAREPLPCSSLVPAPPAPDTAAPRSRTLLWAWCGSRRDLAFKLAAAAGILLALHGAAKMGSARWTRWREDRAYSAALAAARGRDDQALIRDGSAYLTLAGRPAEPRSEQIQGLLSEALVREAAKAVRAGRAEEGRGLLLAHRDLLRDGAVPGASQPAEVAP